jgi:hypothetical protein
MMALTGTGVNPPESDVPRIARKPVQLVARVGERPDGRPARTALLLMQGMHPKVVSEMLGHATIRLTLDTSWTTCSAPSRPPKKVS